MTTRWNKELFEYQDIPQEEPQIQIQTIGDINIHGNNNVININRDTITIIKNNNNRETPCRVTRSCERPGRALSRKELMDRRIRKIFIEKGAVTNGNRENFQKIYKSLYSDKKLREYSDNFCDEKSRKAKIRDYVLDYGYLIYKKEDSYRVTEYGNKGIMYISDKRGSWALIREEDKKIYKFE